MSTSDKAACALAQLEIKWLLTGAGNGRTDMMADLYKVTGISCSTDQIFSKQCVKSYYLHLVSLSETCAEHSPVGRSLLNFILWQGKLKQEWGIVFFENAKKLLKTDLSDETAIVLMGALRNSVRLLKKKPKGARITDFIRFLGFSCPKLSSKWTTSGAKDPGTRLPSPGGCLPTCKNSTISEPLFNFSLRRSYVIKNCPPKSLGLKTGDEKIYIAPDNYLVFKTGMFFRKMYNHLKTSNSLFVKANIRWINETWNEFKELSLFISIPKLNSTEPGFITIPLSFAGQNSPLAKWYIIMDEFGNTRTGTRVLFFPADAKMKGTRYPGKKLFGDWAVSFQKQLSKHHNKPPLLILDSKMPVERFNIIMTILASNKIPKVELLFRNTHNLLRSFTVFPVTKPSENSINMQFGVNILSLTAKTGRVAKKPFKSESIYDFSGLRQYLENIKWRYSLKTRISLKLKHGISYGTIARMLGFLTVNSSGRDLFSKVEIVASKIATDSVTEAPSAAKSVK